MTIKLTVQDESGEYRTATRKEVFCAANKAAQAYFNRRPIMLKPSDSAEYLRLNFIGKEQEEFCMMSLDNRHRVIAFDVLFTGTVDGCAVHPREVVKLALHRNAAAVVLAHNHPSGMAGHSGADERITQKLVKALALVEIRVLDHIVCGSDETTSFAERGLL